MYRCQASNIYTRVTSTYGWSQERTLQNWLMDGKTTLSRRSWSCVKDNEMEFQCFPVWKARWEWIYQESWAHLSTGVDVFSMKLIIFSFTFTDLDLRANVILLTKDLTPLPSAELLSDSPWMHKGQNTTADTIHRSFKVVLSRETRFHVHRRSWGCCEIPRCWRSSGCTKSPDLPHSCPPDVFEELKTQGLQFSVPSAVEKSHSTF